MIIPFIWPWGAMTGGGSAALTPAEFEFAPVEGDAVQIPDAESLIINVLLWPQTPHNEVELRLPGELVAGRRIFIYLADNSIAQLTVTAGADIMVANNIASMNENDLVVLNTVSTAEKIIARVATS